MMRFFFLFMLFFSPSSFAIVLPGGVAPAAPPIGTITFTCLRYPLAGTVPCTFSDLLRSQVQTQNLIVLSVAACLFFLGFVVSYKSNAVLRTGGDS